MKIQSEILYSSSFYKPDCFFRIVLYLESQGLVICSVKPFFVLYLLA